MARKPEFDRDAVLENAMGAFWEHGYEATSLAKLLAVTGLSKSSLYAAFGDKHQLFVAAFDLYRDRQLEHLTKVLNAHSAPQGIRAFFEEVIGVGLEACQRFGCMSTNQAAELALSDGVVSNRVAEDHRRLEDAFTEHLRAGQGAGSVPTDVDARVAASALVTALSGFQLTVRAGMDRTRLERSLAYLMAPLEVAAN
ncbi:TetR/AcrR family transcriptional regulator [Paeniglutamicibacter kerguelensis]|uniref:TetR/AcrR family transcriptional repressor of nem operon n=1 Tax=Paeniglutamicibacter kerguelensis TaxID=254788 RepID=A0ABS4XBW9_9MICC|nr:TetR/AcrR family transcriptional regulator [Paeniglutamicibacter kerguelensis]MBP2385878.1 TetR/AcrR family transcriptional repressor of nem operon [Paeniglutamicibacter kerguelensis]